MKAFRLLAATLTAIAATLAATAQTQYYRVTVNDFSELNVDNNITVTYRCDPDSAGIAVLSATPQKADWILFNNNGKGKLTILSDADYPYGEALPAVTVYSSSLSKVRNSGDSVVTIANNVKVDRFRATLMGNGTLVINDVEAPMVKASISSGNGQLIITGVCDEASFSDVGTGTIQADNLRAAKVSASVVGTGTIGCYPTESLSVSGIGSGNVVYRGQPAKIKKRGVGIHVSPIE